MSVIQLSATQIRSFRNALLPISLVAALSTSVLTFQTSATANSLSASSSDASVSLPQRSNLFSPEWVLFFRHYSGCALTNYVDLSIDIPNMIDTSDGCYELRLNGRFAHLIGGWSLQQIIADLEQQKINNPDVIVDGYFNGFKIGYELYWDGVRVGYEPSWTLQEAIANLEWNKANHPDKYIEGRFYGFKVGYELYWDDVRVGYEPGWTYEQALENLQQNRQAHPDKTIAGSYNDASMP